MENSEIDIDIGALRSEAEILHLIYHRNKNQFRRTKWWTQFAILHRRCWKMIRDLESGETEQFLGTVKFLKKKLIPSAYRSFHNVLAQGQFVTLGLAIITLLARINQLLQSSNLVEENTNKAKPATLVDDKMDLDVGEMLSREDFEKEVVTKKRSRETTDAPATTSSDVSSSSSKENKKKKSKKQKKGSSAIDDIFGI